MKRWITPLATLAGTAVLAAGVHGAYAPSLGQVDSATATGKKAQKPPTDKKAKPADQSKKTEGEKPAAADEEEPAPLYNSLELAYTTWKGSHNLNSINQNGTVNGGFGLAKFSVLNPFDHQLFYA